MLKRLFILGVITLPFSDFLGLHILGEMQHDLSGHIMTLTLALSMLYSYYRWYNIERYKKSSSYHYYQLQPEETILCKIILLFLFIAFASFLANFANIMNAYAFQRYGIGKFFAGMVMFVFGFSFAFLAMSVGRKYPLKEIVIFPMSIGILICAFFGIFEGLSGHIGGIFETIQNYINEITHAGFKDHPDGYNPPTVWGGSFGYFDKTLWHTRSVSFEPPAFADYLGMAWPWICGGYLASKGTKKRYYGFVCLLAIIMMGFSGARTGYLFIILSIAIVPLLRKVYLSEKSYSKTLSIICTTFMWLLFISIIGLIVLNYDDIIATTIANYNEIDGRSVSNLSRLGMTTAGWYAFFDAPIFGHGFGQYGFIVKNYLPNWAWKSWEVQNWFTGIYVWPSAYSTYAKFASEMGLLGLLLWVGLWYGLARSIIKITVDYNKVCGSIPIESYPLVMSCYAVLLRSIASDSMRSPILWLDLGFCCMYIAHKKALIKATGYVYQVYGKAAFVKKPMAQ